MAGGLLMTTTNIRVKPDPRPVVDDKFFDNHIEKHLEPFLTTEQLSKLMCVHADSVRRWICEDRNFPVHRFGRANRYRVSEVTSYFKNKRRRGNYGY